MWGKHFDALWFATALLLITTGSAAAQAPGGVDVNPYGQGQPFDDADCHQMREECRHHVELGEQGRGACPRYRQLCHSDNRVTRMPGY